MIAFEAPPRFRLVRQLGEGGMGIVYEALDTERGVRVALKTLRDLTPRALASFKREFRALQDIHHPNLISLGELISVGDTWFFTMELVSGRDFVTHVRERLPRRHPDESTESASGLALRATIRRDDPLADSSGFDEVRLRSALRQIAQALAALHDAGMVHRDVKPSNVLVTEAGRVVLLDFGLVSHFMSERSMTAAAIAGTPAYMAPEQAAGGEVGPPADWYAVGTLLYETLTGRLPFEGRPLEVMMRKQHEEPPRASLLAGGVPADLDDLCAKLLRIDPRERAMGAHLLRALGGARDAAVVNPSSTTQRPPFIGRRAELETLRKAFDDSRRGGAVIVLVDGESGIGKSCVVRHFTETLRIESGDVVVLAGRCYEREAVPYKGFDGIVDSLTRFLAHLPEMEVGRLLPTKVAPLAQVFPVLRRVDAISRATRGPQSDMDPTVLRRRAFALLRDLLVRLGDWRPVVVVIDDLQWADVDSLALLDDVLRPPDTPALLLVGTIRSGISDGNTTTTRKGEPAPALRGRIPGDVRGIHLARLSAEEGKQLALALLERTGVDADATALAREAEGHPLFIDTLVRHSAHGHAGGALDEALWGHVTSLDPMAQRIVAVLATAGTPIAQAVLAGAVEADPNEFARSVSLLRVAHLVNTAGARGVDMVELYHDRVRAAVLAHVTTHERMDHHRALARALERCGSDDAEMLASHWRDAGDLSHAAQYAIRAGEQTAQALAFDRAARWYEAALALWPHSDVARRALQEKLGDVLAYAGRGTGAAARYLDAAAGAPAALGLDLRRRAADQLLRSGHFDEGLETISLVLDEIGLRLPKTPIGALVQFVFWRVVLRLRGYDFTRRDSTQIAHDVLTRIDVCSLVSTGLGTVDPVRGAAFQPRTLLLALRVGEPHRIARLMATEVAYAARGGSRSWPRTEALIERLATLVNELGDPHLVAWRDMVTGAAHFFGGHFRKAIAALDSAQVIFRDRCKGAFWELDTAQQFALYSLAFLGELPELARRRDTYLREATERGDLYTSVTLRIGFPAMTWLADDDPGGAIRDTQEAMAQWSKKGFHVEHYQAMMSLAQADLYAGHVTEAYARVEGEWPALVRSLLRSVQSIRVVTSHLRARCAIAAAAPVGRERTARLRRATREARDIERQRVPWAMPLARLLRAAVALQCARPRREEAIGLVRAAAAEFTAADMGLYAAASKRALGEMLEGEGGRALVREADAWMAAHGVKSPARMMAMLAPGLTTPGD